MRGYADASKHQKDDERFNPEAASLPYRFTELVERSAPGARPLLEKRLIVPYSGIAAMAELRDYDSLERNCSAWIQPLLQHFMEERGATTVKIAASQALKSLAQSLLNRMVVNYLLTGRAPRVGELRFLPRGKAPWIELFLDPRIMPEEVDFDPDKGPSELFQLSITIENIVNVLHAALGRRKTPKPVFFSSVALAILSPLMVARRHGAHPQEVASLMRRLLPALGKDINSGVVWRQRVLDGRTEYAPRRKACCLKYALPDKPHLCSTCSRRPETLFFEKVPVLGGHDTADGR
ncbi:hypothetical protein PUV47_04830 [Pseudovibrio exalbescens]|uniref:hypothetical protein n=1 Tax=Pseudovibrio exalbescens TaxID=197461 RepID=UPI002365A804|nr:hypothetical protein [Pseudovibrio exalbescens]MDD7909232.1 hypothetical protein [Pseudovibrio exalbescens]